MSMVQNVLGAPTIGSGGMPGKGLGWWELKEANKPPSCSKYMKTAPKAGDFHYLWTKKSPKMPYFLKIT
jgi:hypothetical protein